MAGASIHAFAKNLQRYPHGRGFNAYVDAPARAELAAHLASHVGCVLAVGESSATPHQAVAFTDASRSSNIFNGAVGLHRVARWNAWPFWLPPGRKPSVVELRLGAALLLDVVVQLGPRHVVAVGRVAEKTLLSANIKCEYVPHPAQDKAALFRSAMVKVLGVHDG